MKSSQTLSYRIISFVFILLILHWSENLDGQILSQNSNYQIKKTQHEQVFISSLDGLNIYDGRNVQVFRTYSDGLQNANIQSDFFEDVHGNVWTSSFAELIRYNVFKGRLETFQFKDLDSVLIQNDYRAFHLQGDTLWVQADNYTFWVDVVTGKPIARLSTDLADYYTFEIEYLENNTLKILAGSAEGEGLMVETINKNLDIIETCHFDNISVFATQIVDTCTIMATTFFGELVLFDFCTYTIISRDEICKSGIYEIEILSDTLVNLYTQREGIFEYNLNTTQVTHKVNDRRYSHIKDKVVLSHENVDSTLFFVGLEGEGIKTTALKPKFQFHSLLDDKFESESIIHCVALDNLHLFISVSGKGNYIYDKVSKTFTKLGELGLNVIHSSVLTSRGLIIAIDDKVYILDDSLKLNELSIQKDHGFKKVRKLILVEDRIFSLVDFQLAELKILKDKAFFICDYDSNLDESNITAVNSNDGKNGFLTINNEYSLKFEIEESGYLNVTTKLNCAGQIKHVHNKDSLKFYFATTNGLFYYDEELDVLTNLAKDFRELNQTIYAIYEDTYKRLWLSTNSGILLYLPEQSQVYNFGTDDGAQGLEYNTDAHFQTSDGHILFGGMQGLDFFHPDSITISDYKAPVFLSSLSINEEPYTEQTAFTLDSLRLKHTENTLTFGFHAIDYTASENTLTKYKLVGKDNEYSQPTSENGEARYSNLEPGDYVFTVMGANADHVWNPTPRTLHITILPPWYATWWARTLWVLLGLSTIYLLFRGYYKRQLRERDLALREANLIISKQKALADERTRIAAEMHDDLGGGLTSIRFLSQKALKSVANTELKAQVSRIVQLSEGLVKNMSEIIWAMDAGFDTVSSLISYIRRYAFEYLEDYPIELKFMVEGKSPRNITLTGKQRRNIFLVIKESIHNTVKHAKADTLTIRFNVHNSLKIEIYDNGVGIQESAREGNGLKNIKKRIEDLQGSVAFTSTEGTSISIDIPLTKS